MSRLVSGYHGSFCWVWPAALMGIASCTSVHPGTVDHSANNLPRPIAELRVSESKDLGQIYADNSSYMVFDVDINRDGELDRVVSSAKNMGDELILLLRDRAGFRKVLKTSNLSEDGGRVFEKIDPVVSDSAANEVFTITNAFPKGEDVAEHYVSYVNGEWVLSRTVYTVSDWRDVSSSGHRCEVAQGIPMQDIGLNGASERIRQLPEAELRDEVCEVR